MLEFSDVSSSTEELNWLAIQAAPAGAQLETASLDSWTTGTECKTISFQQVSLVSSFKCEFLYKNSFLPLERVLNMVHGVLITIQDKLY